MKKAFFIFLSLVTLVLLFVTCHKKPQLQIHKLEITDEHVEVTPYSATITANYSYPGAVPQIKVFVSTSNSMSNAIETDAVLDEHTMTATVNGLNSDTKYYYRFRYSNGMKLVDTEIKDFTTEHAIVVPTLTTITAASITSNSAVSGGNISDDGGSEITARGVCWSDEPNPTIKDNHTENGTGSGSYISNLTNLDANTVYYVKAYATNGEGTGYGNEIMFVTSAALATISTKPVTDVTENSAKSGGNITNSGGMEITAHGVCWSTEHNPTINDSHTTDGTGIGEFVSEITGLDANVVYYIRAYATSSYGTAYGEERSFTTIAGMPVVTTKSVTGITASSANCGGNVINSGGENITARGVCWATNQNPTISDSHTSDGIGTGEFTSTITGLTNNVTYYVRAYATNSNGTAYGEERSFTTQEGLAVVTTNDITSITDNSAVSGGVVADDGGFSITARGVCWSTSQNPTTNDAHTSDGSGTGSYTSNMSSLSYNTTYYVRAYATNSKGTSYGEEKTFTTNKIAPTVTTTEATSITSNSAICGGNVTSDGGATVTARGVCYGTSQNPTISGNHTSDGNGIGQFTSNLTGLTENTTYYIRAYATNSEGTSYGEQKSFTTEHAVTLPTVTTTNVSSITQTTAVSGGNVTSAGYGTVNARGVCYSTSHNPTITNAHTTNGTGTGTFTSNISGLATNTTYYVRAYATNEAGTAYGEQKTFTTSSGGTGNAPTGAIDGLFSVSSTEQVYFSQGNIQYQASTDTWRFAEHQYDYVGYDNANISSSYDGWIDLFGWGTSGYNHGANCYQPWSISIYDDDYYAYSSLTYDLSSQTCQADWGFNAISNGGNTTNTWRTPTKNEWVYVFNTRSTSSGIRYAKAIVNNINGVILLPDNWNGDTYLLNETNNNNANYNSNVITTSVWINTFEANGAVFLPAAGARNGTSISSSVDSDGLYWTATHFNNQGAWIVSFENIAINLNTWLYRHEGISVRLIYSSQSPSVFLPTVTTNQVTNIEPTSATCGGNVTSDGGSTITSRGVCWSTSQNPTISDLHTTNGTGTGAFSSTLTDLSPNTTYYIRAYATNVAGISYGAQVSFTTEQEQPQVPTGAINGLFTINANGDQVYFSKGNLQYQASTNTWRFAENQWDYIGGTDAHGNNYGNVIGSSNSNISSNYSGWIDLFGWGTSGYNHGAVCYQPWSTSDTYSDYYAYGGVSYNLNDQTGKADWGYNVISNGGNTESIWRTLTRDEWTYVFYTRSTTSGIKFAKAQVNEVDGVILLPNEWSSNIYSLNNTDNGEASFSSNIITVSDWNTKFESNGAVFLPVARYRQVSLITAFAHAGFYWSSTRSWSYNHYAYDVFFDNSYMNTSNDAGREFGQSVRLVHNARF